MTPQSLLAALRQAVRDLEALGREFALVGGVAVSVRAEARFTRDVDLAVVVRDDADAEALVVQLHGRGYTAVAIVEHETQHRLSTVRLSSPSGMKLDLLFASSGIEGKLSRERRPSICPTSLPVAEAEELLSMKILSMDDRRLQDHIDAERLVTRNPDLVFTADLHSFVTQTPS